MRISVRFVRVSVLEILFELLVQDMRYEAHPDIVKGDTVSVSPTLRPK